MEGYTNMFDTPQSSRRTIPWILIITYGIVAIGILLNLLFIVPNGDYSCLGNVCGIRIGEWHYHDALWHIAVARNSFQSFPFVFPSAAGFALTSYNYLLGAILYILEKLWINPFFTYFKLLPILGNIALAYTLFRYFHLTQKTDIERLWITFFTYLGSSFSFFLIFYRNDFAEFSILKGFPVIATLQPSFVLSNIQFFLTLPIILYILTNILIGRPTKYTRLTESILLSLSLGLKIYSGIFILLLLILGSVRRRLHRKNHRSLIMELALYFAVSIGSVYVFFMPFSKHGQGFPFIWNPIAIPHAITESPGLLYHKDFTLGRYFMYDLHTISPRLILYEMISVLLFIVWNLGSRLVFIYGVLHDFLARRIKYEEAILLVFGFVGLLMPVFFIQNGGGWYNIIQFAYIGVYLMGILAGLSVAKLWRSHSYLAKIIIVLVVIFTLPNNVLMFRLLEKEKEIIPAQELKALSFLRSKPSGVVLSFPDNKNSSYVPALSAKTGYMIDYEQSALLDLPTEDIIQAVEKRDCAILEKVDYVYLNSPKGVEYASCQNFALSFKSIYSQDDIRIYQK